MPGDAIIIGTGQIGITCAKQLLEQGWSVTTIARSANPFLQAGIEHRIADRFDTDQLQHAIGDGADLLIDTIAFDASDSGQLVKLRDRLGAIAVISSASVYCDEGGRTLDEAATNGFPEGMVDMTESQTTVTPGPANYSTRKIAMEQALLEGAESQAIIVRPCAIHGPFSRHPREWWFVKRVLDGRRFIPLAGEGHSRFQTTAAISIANLICDLVEANTYGVFNCADEDSPSVNEIGIAIAAFLNADVEFISVSESKGTVGRTPWSVPQPFTTRNAKARALGIGRFARYETNAKVAVKWLADLPVDSWENRFPQLAAYPWNHFDYMAEDAWLGTAKLGQ